MSVQYGAISWNRQKKVYDSDARLPGRTLPRHLCGCRRVAKPERNR